MAEAKVKKVEIEEASHAPKIYKTIISVMEEIGSIGKNKKNQVQGFMYRGIDDVMNALNPAMIKFGLFITPNVLEQTRELVTNNKGTQMHYSLCKIEFTFWASDGSNIKVTTIGEGMDSGDKATNKAMSIALKYACFQVFCIPTEEMVDPDADSPETVDESVKGAKGQPTATNSVSNTKSKDKPIQEDPNKVLVKQPHVEVMKNRIREIGKSESEIIKWINQMNFRNYTKLDEFTMFDFNIACKAFDSCKNVQ